MRQIRAVLIGGGARGRIYAQYAGKHPDELSIVAIAEPYKDRRNSLCQRYSISPERAFESWEELLALPQIADVAIVCTLDDMHTKPAIAALKKGYHVLLEKPMSSSEGECRQIAGAAKESGRVLSVCHVLRYTPFYQAIKKLIDDGKIGEVVSLAQIENVGYWHHAHSFVRGNWRSSRETSPMILQKSCHDMDILLWLCGQRSVRVSSFGSLRHFTPSHAPVHAPGRCTDGCPHGFECPYDARKIYLSDNIGWPTDMLTTDLSIEGRLKALREGPYGRCVYYCDNDVVDRQVVIIEFDKGAVATFTMTAFTTDMARQLKVCGTNGQIMADMNTNQIVLHQFGKEREQIQIEVPNQTNNYGHGGGDYYLMRDFLQAVREHAQGRDSLTSAEVSLQSHLLCFAAEKSRLQGQVVEL